MAKWEDAPLLTTPPEIGSWEDAPLVTEQAESLVSRFGKQFYNAAFATPAHELAKSDITAAEAEAYQIQQQRIKKRKTQGMKFSTMSLNEEFEDITNQLYQLPAARESEDLKAFPKFEQKQDINYLAAKTTPPETWAERGIDMTAGVAAIAAQIALLREVVPTGTSESIIWEIQNQLSGGKPGMGAVYGATMGGIAKLPATELGKTTAESAAFYSLARIEGATPSEALKRAAIPAALRGVSALRRGIKYRGVETEPQIITRGAGKKGLISREVAGIRRLGKLPIEQPTLESTVQKVSDWSKDAKILRATEVKKALKELHKRQAWRGAEIIEVEKGKGTPLWNSIGKSKAGYKGKAAVPEITPLSLSKAEKEVLADKIMKLYPKTHQQFKRTNTQIAVDKMVNGKVPANFEFELLEPVLGVEKTINLYKQIKPVPSLTAWDIPAVTWQVAKFCVGADVQSVRQLSSYAALEPVLYGKAVGINAEAYASNLFGTGLRAKQRIMKVANDPQHAEAVKNGVSFYGYKPYGKWKAGTRPEWVMGRIPEKMMEAGLKRGTAAKTLLTPIRLYGKWLTAAEQGNIAGINTFQQLAWNKGADQLKLTAKSPQQLNLYLQNYAKTLNTFSKILQAKTPQGREIQSAAQWVLFSPSMTAGRPLSIKAMMVNKGSRAYAAQLLATNVAKITALSGLANLAGNSLGLNVNSEINPLSSDWGKIRVGNTHIDFFGGDAQFYRTLVRLAVGGYVKTVGGGFPTRIGKWRVQEPKDIIKTYAKTRETAAINAGLQLLEGRDFWGEKIPRWKALSKALSPQILTDFFESLMSDGVLTALLAGGAATMSAGVMVYPQSAWQQEQEFKDELAKTAHGTKWDELTNIQQSILRAKNTTKFKDFDLKKKQEHKLRPAEISLEEQRKAGQWVTKQLSSDQRHMIEESGVSVNISRTIGDWWLNDKRYRKYRRLTAKYLKEGLDGLEKNAAWQTTRDSRLIQFVVDVARMKAKIDVQRSLQTRRSQRSS